MDAKGGVLDMDNAIVSNVASHKAGYVDQENEVIVGLQTDKPFKLAFMPNGGLRTAEQCLTDNGYSIDQELHDFYVKIVLQQMMVFSEHIQTISNVRVTPISLVVFLTLTLAEESSAYTKNQHFTVWIA